MLVSVLTLMLMQMRVLMRDLFMMRMVSMVEIVLSWPLNSEIVFDSLKSSQVLISFLLAVSSLDCKLLKNRS